MKKGEIDGLNALAWLYGGTALIFVVAGCVYWAYVKTSDEVIKPTVTDTVSYKAWTNTAQQLQRLTRRVEILEEYSAYKAHADGNFSEIVLIPMYASSNAIRTNLSATLPHSGPMLDGRGVP